MKNRILAVLISLICLTLLGSRADAHNGDYAGGVYTNSQLNPSLLKIKVKSSAITSLLTSSVYYSATEWNGISSNVEVAVIMHVPGQPDTNFIIVNGFEPSDGTLGETMGLDSTGHPVSFDSNWYCASIKMNTKSNAFSGSSNPTTAAKKTFKHEVGHALKLDHPIINSSYSGHIYSGRPKAIMNQGFPESNNYNSSSIEQHDKNNLIAKWGS